MATPNALTFNGYMNAIGALAVANRQTVASVVQFVNTDYQTLVPQMLNYAELRIQRDLALSSAMEPNTYTTTINNNLLSIPVADFVTVDSLSVVVSGLTYPLLPVSKFFLQNCYGSVTGASIPSSDSKHRSEP